MVHRLAECPSDFLAAPLVGGAGVVSVAAVVGDVVRPLGLELPDDWLAALAPAHADAPTANWLRACLVAAWLAADAAVAPAVTCPGLLGFLGGDLLRIAPLVSADDLVRDPDRREELARSLLRSVGFVPSGETRAQADDRLATLDSAARTRVESEARAAEERAREVRAALERQRATEAAARASRE
jgi:hypothetical protein